MYIWIAPSFNYSRLPSVFTWNSILKPYFVLVVYILLYWTPFHLYTKLNRERKKKLHGKSEAVWGFQVNEGVSFTIVLRLQGLHISLSVTYLMILARVITLHIKYVKTNRSKSWHFAPAPLGLFRPYYNRSLIRLNPKLFSFEPLVTERTGQMIPYKSQ